MRLISQYTVGRLRSRKRITLVALSLLIVGSSLIHAL